VDETIAVAARLEIVLPVAVEIARAIDLAAREIAAQERVEIALGVVMLVLEIEVASAETVLDIAAEARVKVAAGVLQVWAVRAVVVAALVAVVAVAVVVAGVVVVGDSLRGFAKSRPCRDLKSSLRSLRTSVISALNISRDYSYAEITEIRRDRREKSVSCKNRFSGKASLKS
jgi:hypothetical protein